MQPAVCNCSNINHYLNTESTTVVFKLVESNGPEPHMSCVVGREEEKTNTEIAPEPLGSVLPEWAVQ